ncbi:MAG: DUF1524 domain-containing protein [Aliifodinibius sp.]|nr:HNH endonuclease [Fodinibius sp.]NIV12161.1 DUF1524 domain-containing protein [Fodinibius sp.]NIY30626.1 DUF1524 domain-containing protein [Fodinibius sp.]
MGSFIRFLIQRERGGKLDEGYARLANLIFKEEVNSPDSLKQASKGFCPTDAQFKSQFKEARVGKAPLARYYLRSLEQTAISEKYPEFVPNDDIVVTLEHIMPKQLHESNWPNTTEQDIETHCNRIGNLCLLTVDKNTKLGNESFEEKKRVYSQSSFTLTKNLADFKGWGIDDIEKRQTMLADLAVKTWKID